MINRLSMEIGNGFYIMAGLFSMIPSCIILYISTNTSFINLINIILIFIYLGLMFFSYR